MKQALFAAAAVVAGALWAGGAMAQSITPPVGILRTDSPTLTGSWTWQKTIGLNLGSGVITSIGDSVSADNLPFLTSYKVGSSSGAAAYLGFNWYVNTAGAGGTRINSSRNGWALAHDARNATTDGDLTMQVVSSGGVLTTPYTFGATGALLVNNVATTSAMTSPRYTLTTGRTLTMGATSDAAVNLFASMAGTYSGAFRLIQPYSFNINTDDTDPGAANGISYLGVQGSFGGSNTKGHRTGISASIFLDATTGNGGSVNAFYTALAGFTRANATDPFGNVFGINTGAIAQAPNGSSFNSIVGLEVDIQADAGNAVNYKQGMKIVLYGDDATQGTFSDYAYGMARAANTTSVGLKMGLNFLSEDGWWPIDATVGVMIGSGPTAFPSGAPPKAANYGIKFDDIAFATASIAVPGLTVGPAGYLTLATSLALSGGSGPVLLMGDATTANSDPLVFSYQVGSSSGAISALGFNYYRSTGGSETRVNTAKNAWAWVHDVRNATNDASLTLQLVSSAGSSVSVAAFNTAGALSLTGSSTVFFNANGASSGYRVANTQVVGPRRTGWGAPTGTLTRTTFDTSTVTTQQLAERVAALITDLTTHGLIGP